MIANINARKLTNEAIFVQYTEDGKAKDAAFMSWQDFINWLAAKIEEEHQKQAAAIASKA